uniref:Putative ovule protein n=1 Tax=Solanum chacoense TaxID=4108 RepID=A0A0V0HI56_SOLCH
MDGNNWRAAQAQGGGEGGGAAAGAMDSGDWRTQLLPDSRQRIVNKIMETLKRHLPVSGQEGVQELKKIAVRFEEKIYSAATSQQDYLRKISLKMLTMETKSQTPMTNSVQPNPASSGQNALGPGMTLEATSYETTSGPEDSDKEAAEEDDEGVFKEDVVEEVVGTKEQNYVVGHKNNVRVVENERR